MREEAGGQANTRARAFDRSRARVVLAAVLLACDAQSSDAEPETQAGLRVGASTSVQESGLFAVIAEGFSAQTQHPVVATFVSTRDLLAAAKAGQVDLLWLQSRPQEDAFIAEGYGINRRDIMYGEYVIVGPPGDPAGIGKADSAVDALGLVADAAASFVSRADESSTHVRERLLWKLARVEPDPTWYAGLDAGMLPTLQRASERGAYALSDLPTFLLHRQRLELEIWVRGDPRLKSGYAATAVNPMRVSGTNYAAAMAFVEFLTSASTQALIGDFGREQHGTPLFHPSDEGSSVE